MKQSLFVLLILMLSAGCSHVAQRLGTTTYSYAEELEQLGRADLLPRFRTDEVVEQQSSYDTTGGNNDGFNGTYSQIRIENGHPVIAEFQGPGVINRIWTPTPTHDTLEFYFDGETEARLRLPFMDLFSGKVYPFIQPLCGNEVGGYYCYVPIPYSRSCKIVYTGEKMLFYQIQARALPGKEVSSYTGNLSEEERNALRDAAETWSAIAPSIERFARGESEKPMVIETQLSLRPGKEASIFGKKKGGRIVGIEINGGTGFEGFQKDVLLKAVWDGEKHPAIEAPLADLFGYAFGRPAMRSLLVGSCKGINYWYLPCPFDKEADVRLVYKQRADTTTQVPVQLTARVFYTYKELDPSTEGKLYTTWRRETNVPMGKPYEFANLTGKGHYVGTILQSQAHRAGMTEFFEGDDSTSVDGRMRIHGTGSEDYFNGGWYALLDRWDRGVSLPLHGCLDYSLQMARTGGYRFFTTDKMSFEQSLYSSIEHGPEGNNYPVDYTSVAFYYAREPQKEASMEPTEELRTVTFPREHIFYPQLMQFSVGHGSQVVLDGGLRLSSSGNGLMSISLPDIPEGTYRVSISYVEQPDGADFSVWQRQKQLAPIRSSKAPERKVCERILLGTMTLTPQTNSLTFKTHSTDGSFILDRIFLEKEN